MIRNFTLVLLSLIAFTSFSQNEIDSRLRENQVPNLKNVFEHRKDYYNYLVYELDHGYIVADESELTQVQLDAATPKSAYSNNDQALTLAAINQVNFNFKKFGLAVFLNDQTIVALAENKYLIIRSKNEIAAEFSNNPLSHK